jgi:hypothetical protein
MHVMGINEIEVNKKKEQDVNLYGFQCWELEYFSTTFNDEMDK